MDNYDLLAIGSGPAGQRASIQAAKLGKKVAIVDKSFLIGGVSLHTGTIPSKTLREAVLYLSGWRQRGFYGRSYRTKQYITAEDLTQRLDQTIRGQVETLQHQLFRNYVDVIGGTASFIDPHTLLIETGDEKREIRAEKIVIATGTTPARPQHIPFDEKVVLDSDGILELKELPHSMVVVGAGVIGAEYASIFSALDIEITLLDGRDKMMDFLDDEIVDEFIHNMRDRDMTIRLGETVTSIERDDRNRAKVKLKSGKQICADMVLFAAGRQGSTGALKVENAGLTADERGRLVVNEHYQTEVDHIYAAGDVIGFPSLASTSMEQGRYAACHAFGAKAVSNVEFFPIGIYAVPEMSMVGMTEQEARAKDIPYETGTARFREIARGQILGLREGILKMLFSLEDRKLIGVHIVGEGATELIHIGQAVLALGGTLDYFVTTVFNYPTLAEAYKVAALDAYNRFPKD
ncbi:MAG: NAD(P) transhydrogenase [Gammaproteobacteria bacterium]